MLYKILCILTKSALKNPQIINLRNAISNAGTARRKLYYVLYKLQQYLLTFS